MGAVFEGSADVVILKERERESAVESVGNANKWNEETWAG